MRFTGRKEYFGSIFFDREKNILLPFDHLGTAILEALGEYSLPAVKKAFARDLSGDEIEAFVNHWRDEGLVDEGQAFKGCFIMKEPCDGFLSSPLRVYMDFTSGCNLRCLHCVSSSERVQKDELTTDAMKEIFISMRNAGVFELNIGGGEPLYRKDALELLHCASETGFVLYLTTNATLIDEKMAKSLEDLNIRYLNISLDGARRETHDYIRGKGAFRKAIKGIENLSLQTGHHLCLHMTLMRSNVNELKSFFELGEKLPVHSYSVGFIRYQGRARDNKELLLSQEEYRTALWEALELSRHATKTAIVKTFLPDADTDGSTRLYKSFSCGAAQVTCHLDSFGNLSPCNYFDTEGRKENVRLKSITTIWREGAFFNQLRNLQGNEKCRSCRYFKGCRGGCRAQAEQFYGDLNAPDFHCLNESHYPLPQ
ncbi:MAG: radical SAM/SPASM domain-containing protein [Candidatus Xenobiia bacterium LiM19]